VFQKLDTFTSQYFGSGGFQGEPTTILLENASLLYKPLPEIPATFNSKSPLPKPQKPRT